MTVARHCDSKSAGNLQRIGVLRSMVLVIALAASWMGATAPTQVAAQTPDVGAGGLQIVEHGSRSGPAGTLRLLVQLPGVIAPRDSLSTTIHEPVASEADFLASVRGEDLGGVLAAWVEPVEDLDPDPFGLVEIIVDLNPQDGTLPIEPGQIRLARPGVYPVSLEIRTSDQDLVGRVVTHLIRLPDPTQASERVDPLPVVIVAALPTGDEDELSGWLATLSSYGDIATTITATPQELAAVADSPEYAAFVAVGGRKELIRAPWFPVDEHDLRRAGLDLPLDDLLLRGDQAIAQTGFVAPPTLWVDSGGGSADLLQELQRRGVRDVIVHRDTLLAPPFQPGRGPVEIAAGDIAVRGLVVDQLAAPQAHDTPVSAAQRVAAHLATIALLEEGDAVITLDASSIGDVTYVGALFDELAALPLIDTRLASEALGSPLAVDAIGQPQSFELVGSESEFGDWSGFFEAAADLAAYRSMIRDEDTDDHDRLAAELEQTLSSATTSADRQAVWRGIRTFVRQQTSLVDAPPVNSIRMTARQATVPFSFQNRSERAVRVEVRLISDKLIVDDFDDGESTTIVLEPGVTTHEFELRALGSGSFPVRIELLSPDGGLLVSETRAAIQSTTPTGTALLLTVGAAAFLVIWWFVDFRRRRVV